MRHPVRSFVILAVAAFMAAAFVSESAAQSRTYQPRKKPVTAPSTLPRFALSGDFSGSLTGEIYIEGKAFRIAPDASIYEIGKGLVPLGTSYSNRRIFVSGVQTAGPAVIYSVNVRPARNMALSNVDMSMFVKEKPASAPR